MTTLQEYLNQKCPTRESKEQIKEVNSLKIKEWRKDQGLEKLEGGTLNLREFRNVEKIYIDEGQLKSSLTKLDISGCIELKELKIFNNQLTSVDLDDCVNLNILVCVYNQLTSVDFLNQLPNPEKLEALCIGGNNIQPTDVVIFSRFINLRELKIGSTKYSLSQGKQNKFYGSFQSWKDLAKLRSVGIEATDINEGLEYLPFSLTRATKGGDYYKIECSSHNSQAKCSQIQDQLRPFDYDIEAWQLAHPEKMLIARPELFTNPDSKDKWLTALKSKIKESQKALNYLIQKEPNEPNSAVKTVRLETQIKILEEIENQLREQIEEEREIHQDSMKVMDNFYQQNPPLESIRLKNILQAFEKNYLKISQENKQKEQEIKELKGTIEITEKILEKEYQPKKTVTQATQTDLTMEQIKQEEEQADKETLYQKFIEKYGKK